MALLVLTILVQPVALSPIPVDWQIKADELLAAGLKPKDVVDSMVLRAAKAHQRISATHDLHQKVCADHHSLVVR